jgi:DNA-binding transcriptional regulator YiaG
LRFLCAARTVLGMEVQDMSTGIGIKILRTGQGLSLRQLAELANTSATYISQVERGVRIPTTKWKRSVIEALADNLRGAA